MGAKSMQTRQSRSHDVRFVHGGLVLNSRSTILEQHSHRFRCVSRRSQPLNESTGRRVQAQERFQDRD